MVRPRRRLADRALARLKNADKPLPHRRFPPSPHTALEGSIWSFATRGGFVIRSPFANHVRLFLGSSAVEHSTVNRMVAGSNPARGAIDRFSANFPEHPRTLQTSQLAL